MGDRREGFGERLRTATTSVSPLCLGIDPSATLLGRWDLEDSAGGVETFGRRAIEAAVGIAAAIKPQVAFFERHGSAGFAALERVLADARDAGIIAIADAKRGDIDSTMAAYGDAWLGDDSSLRADAMTATSYLGLAAMSGVLEQAVATGRGVIVVVASSNPEGRELQEARASSGASVEESLLAELGHRNDEERRASATALGSLGAVIGATRTAGSLDLAPFGGPILVPGVGAQGATPADVANLFSSCLRGSILVNASRSILAAGPRLTELRSAASSLADELSSVLL